MLMADAVPSGLRTRYDEVYSKLLATYAQAIADCKHTNETNHPKRSAPSHPYLISASPRYWKSDYRVMVVGQETRGWYRHTVDDKHYHFTKENATVDQLLNLYEDGFHNPEKLLWSGTFKTGFNKLREELPQKFNCHPSKIGYITNNVIKVGRHKGSGRPCSCVINWQQDAGCLNLLREEICKYYLPTHIVFFSGPNYDYYLDLTFEDLKRTHVSDVFTKRQIAMVSSPDLESIKLVRTYHPGYLTRTGRFDEYIAAVAKSLT